MTRDASHSGALSSLFYRCNASTNPPETAVEPGGARPSSHDVLRVPSGSDQFTQERVDNFMKLARAL